MTRNGIMPAQLVINADDYGYFDCVSRGIIEGAKAGVITATGIMANANDFAKRIAWLDEVPNLDLGVHLNVTYGRPLTQEMIQALSFNEGRFPGKFQVIKALTLKTLQVRDVVGEWRAQIRRCRDSGIEIRFLNSHEHIHMFPPLFRETLGLAREFDIPHVRFSSPEWRGGINAGGLMRNLLMQGMALANTGALPMGRRLSFLGMNESGKLSMDYMRRTLVALRPGEKYEMMCHPGLFDEEEVQDPALLSYHRWEAELEMLKSGAFKALCNDHGIELVGYREITH